MFALTTLLPERSAVSSSERAGSMPPITSTTRSTSSRSTSDVGVGGQQVGRHVGVPVGPAHRDADQLERNADPGGEIVGLLVQQPDDLRADDPAAEQRHPQGVTHD